MTAQRKFQENTGFKQDPIFALRNAASNLFICLSTNHLHLRLYLHASSKFSGEHCQTCIKEQTMKNTYAFNTTVKTVMSATLLLGTLGTQCSQQQGSRHNGFNCCVESVCIFHCLFLDTCLAMLSAEFA